MILPVAALAIAQLFDLATFAVMFARHGAAAELNPIVAFLARDYGLLILAFTKLSLIVLVAAIFTLIVAHRPKLAGFVMVFGTIAGLVGGFSNIASV